VFQSSGTFAGEALTFDTTDANGFSSGAGGFSAAGLDLEWDVLLSFGSTAPVSSGSYVLPEDHPRALDYPGTLCVTAGYAGYDSNGNFKFILLGLNDAADCSGNDISVEITGCWGSGS
jgi:hypothetical protein